MLWQIMCAYNSKVQASTRLSPFKSFFGRKITLPLDLTTDTPAEKFRMPGSYVVETLYHFNAMFK